MQSPALNSDYKPLNPTRPRKRASLGEPTMHYSTIHITQIDGFEVRTQVTPEYLHPRDLFDDTVNDIDQICRDIEAARLEWFIAKVSAHKAGVELAADYLGGCLYTDALQFVRDNDYYADMSATVIAEAKTKIQELAGV
jgi:hypothetical protein